MTRVVKFRLWDQEDNIMWHDFSLGNSDVNDMFSNLSGQLVLMQYVGTNDINQIACYESDIIKRYRDDMSEYRKCIVKYIDCAFYAFPLDDNSVGDDCPTLLIEYPFKIIGNAYQDPKLL